MAWWSSACTSPLEKVVFDITSRSLPEKLSILKELWISEWGLLLMKIMGLDWKGAM